MRGDNYQGAGARVSQSRMRGDGQEKPGSMEPRRGQKHVITNQSKQISSLVINYRGPGHVRGMRLSSPGRCLITRDQTQHCEGGDQWSVTPGSDHVFNVSSPGLCQLTDGRKV